MSLEKIVKNNCDINSDNLCFKTTPLSKVFILCMLTGGIYTLFLIYDYWKTLKIDFGHNVSPFWRTIFCGFTNFSLFPIFNNYFAHFNKKFFNAILLAIIFMYFNYLDGKISFKTSGSDTIDWNLELIMLISEIIITFIMLYIQHNINKINKEHYTNAPQNSWKTSNIIWIIICTVLIVLSYLPQ